MQGDNAVLVQGRDGRWLRFSDPRQVLCVTDPAEVLPVLGQLQRLVDSGAHAAGFLAYEASPGIDSAYAAFGDAPVPLLWFGVYEEPELLEALPPPNGAFRVGAWTPSISEADYRRALARIREYIAAGDTYQVNYTLRLRASFEGDTYALFYGLCRSQQAQHCAFVRAGDLCLCSASPELFFSLDGTRLLTRPMKGTAPRAPDYESDRAVAAALHTSQKNRAENIMIVDMVRNDMGRVADAGSVQVLSTFDVEHYPTVHQLTSTVEATTSASFPELVRALFPCASITGAPKVRTMQIIRELESGPRGIYTGAIGHLSPGRQATFNVAIRTVAVDLARGCAEYGVGGGIVWDSDPAGEYAECLDKARVLSANLPEFDLLESLLWTPEEGYFLLDEHLRRLARAAEYFGFPSPAAEVGRRLEALAASLPREPLKIRLLVGRSGAVTTDVVTLSAGARPHPLRVGVAPAPVDPRDPFLYHKTTHRAAYRAAREARPECDDVILWNEAGEVTEATTANLVVTLDGRRVTPPIRCGLLAGTYREHLLALGAIEERVVRLDDLSRADAVCLINSVRQEIRAVPRR